MGKDEAWFDEDLCGFGVGTGVEVAVAMELASLACPGASLAPVTVSGTTVAPGASLSLACPGVSESVTAVSAGMTMSIVLFKVRACA